MSGFRIPNAEDAEHPTQSEPDARDFLDILLPAFTFTGVTQGCVVTVGSSGMAVKIANGAVSFGGEQVSVGSTTLTIPVGMNYDRFDLICVERYGNIVVVRGTPSQRPVFPDPRGKIVLAAIRVASLVTVLTASAIVDKRVLVSSQVPSSVVPTGSQIGPWYYALPLGTAVADSDADLGSVNNVDFESPWANIGTDGPDAPPTSWRLVNGKPQLRLACTGGEDVENSLILTLPEGFRPSHHQPVDVVMGGNRDKLGTVEVYPDGRVVFVRQIVGGLNAVFFDKTPQVGTFLEVTTTGSSPSGSGINLQSANVFDITSAGSVVVDSGWTRILGHATATSGPFDERYGINLMTDAPSGSAGGGIQLQSKDANGIMLRIRAPGHGPIDLIDEVGGGIFMETQLHGGFLLRSRGGGGIYLTEYDGGGLGLEANGSGGLFINNLGGAAGEPLFISSDVWNAGTDHVIEIGIGTAGKKIAFVDHLGVAILVLDENGDLHRKIGSTDISDL